jgi:hypothetical protein
MSVESEEMWKETAVVYFKALSQNFNGESEENHGNCGDTELWVKILIRDLLNTNQGLSHSVAASVTTMLQNYVLSIPYLLTYLFTELSPS